MAVQHEVGLVALREIRKNLRSTKGIAMFVLFFLGGAVPSVASVLFERAKQDAGFDSVSDAAQKQILENALASGYGSEETAKYLIQCPPSLFFLLQGTLVVLPLLVLLVGFDQLAGDVQHRSIRYVAGRAYRHSIVAGKALGVWAVVGVMVLVLHSTVWAVMLFQSNYSVATTLSWGLRVWLFSVTYAAAYVGLTNLISSFFKTPILALFIGAGIGFGIWLGRLVVLVISTRAESFEAASWVFPASYEKLMVSPNPMHAIGGCALAIAWGAVCVAFATFILRRRDI
jgi:ABC-type transport system involved in multi-copper enzyme maturation permease subunit